MIEALWSTETSGTIYRRTRRGISEDTEQIRCRSCVAPDVNDKLLCVSKCSWGERQPAAQLQLTAPGACQFLDIPQELTC